MKKDLVIKQLEMMVTYLKKMKTNEITGTLTITENAYTGDWTHEKK